MKEKPPFSKYDRYKASSYRAYNLKMPERYDTMFWIRLFKLCSLHQEIANELNVDLSKLHILDVGCATGRLLSQFAQAGCHHLYGIDLAPKILEVAEKKLSAYDASIQLRTADAENEIPWPDNSFDVVTLTGVLHHFYRPLDALSEIYRVLRPNGRLVVIEPWLPPLLRQVINFYLLIIPHDGDCRFRSPQGVVRLLHSTSFEEVRQRKISRLLFIVVGYRKPVAS
jgi:ubiquinone/menaquinone biosynthesis C-methylase UbiE